MGRFGVTYRVGRAKVPFSVSADDPAVKALIDTYNAVSYTHLDVYKRQRLQSVGNGKG